MGVGGKGEGSAGKRSWEGVEIGEWRPWEKGWGLGAGGLGDRPNLSAVFAALVGAAGRGPLALGALHGGRWRKGLALAALGERPPPAPAPPGGGLVGMSDTSGPGVAE